MLQCFALEPDIARRLTMRQCFCGMLQGFLVGSLGAEHSGTLDQNLCGHRGDTMGAGMDQCRAIEAGGSFPHAPYMEGAIQDMRKVHGVLRVLCCRQLCGRQ
ncbi:predicted protein [Streptomyces iranensis]|uniref:Uncharacterized protein n=1 Tax=Streptomyces iranensis TaxID=576784 RepID=A0A060ZHK3_9ACTN|nr:predicted protein [Streptomyces iranensis]